MVVNINIILSYELIRMVPVLKQGSSVFTVVLILENRDLNPSFLDLLKILRLGCGTALGAKKK